MGLEHRSYVLLSLSVCVCLCYVTGMCLRDVSCSHTIPFLLVVRHCQVLATARRGHGGVLSLSSSVEQACAAAVGGARWSARRHVGLLSSLYFVFCSLSLLLLSLLFVLLLLLFQKLAFPTGWGAVQEDGQETCVALTASGRTECRGRIRRGNETRS